MNFHNIIYCIPLEYLKNSEKKNNLWNSVQTKSNKISIWNDSNNFFITNSNYSYHNNIDLEMR